LTLVGAIPLLLEAAGLVAAAYVAWCTHPAVLLCAGLTLSIFSGQWGNFGLPELIAPDRILIVAAIGTVIFRAPAIRDSPSVTSKPIHWLLAATAAYILGSALAAGTFFEKDTMLRATDRVGIVPFLLFALTPVMFAARRHRTLLLQCLVGVGVYLSITALFETTGPKALVFPHFITNPAIGIHGDRARGPFLEAVGNGTALYICLVAAVIAAATWTVRWQRRVAIATVLLCAAGLLFTLTRSVWIGAMAATIVTMLAHPQLRRWLVPVAASAALITAGTLAAVPGLATKASERRSQQDTVWDRLNLDRAALNMAEARPLFGFGWGSFKTEGVNYFEQADTYPLSATNLPVHSAYFDHLAELGLVGTSLWALSTVFAVGLAITRRGPPDLEHWRFGLLAIAMMDAVVGAFVYPYMFGTIVLWLWAGIVYAASPAPLSEQITIRRREQTA
jgi:putative inorganic carbon (hco3(-)) transporter